VPVSRGSLQIGVKQQKVLISALLPLEIYLWCSIPRS
jgi:hypothetical protein